MRNLGTDYEISRNNLVIENTQNKVAKYQKISGIVLEFVEFYELVDFPSIDLFCFGSVNAILKQVKGTLHGIV